MEDNLGELFVKYGSDKHRNGYTPHFHALFKNIRDREINLLEIGIGTMIPGVHSSMVGYALPNYKPGGSLRAWRDYFPHGNIVGADVQPDTQFTEERITTLLCDSTDPKIVEILGDRKFDIIIDDGSHYDESQLKTIRNLWQFVNPGGYYIIEDVYPSSRITTEMRPVIQALVGQDTPLFMTEHKNVMIISKRLKN